MRRVFVIFLAVCFIAFSLDGRFVYSGCSLGSDSPWEERRLMFPCFQSSLMAHRRLKNVKFTTNSRQNIKSPSALRAQEISSRSDGI